MKKLLFILSCIICISVNAQLRISELPEHLTSPNNGFVPLVIGGQTKKFNTGNFVYTGGSYSNPTWLTALSPNKLLQTGATPGQTLIWNGSTWAPGQLTATVSSLPFANITNSPYTNSLLKASLDSTEKSINKATSFSTINHTLYPTVSAVNTWGNSNFKAINWMPAISDVTNLADSLISKAQKDGSNITNASAWRTALSLYSQSESDNRYGRLTGGNTWAGVQLNNDSINVMHNGQRLVKIYKTDLGYGYAGGLEVGSNVSSNYIGLDGLSPSLIYSSTSSGGTRRIFLPDAPNDSRIVSSVNGIAPNTAGVIDLTVLNDSSNIIQNGARVVSLYSKTLGPPDRIGHIRAARAGSSTYIELRGDAAINYDRGSGLRQIYLADSSYGGTPPIMVINGQVPTSTGRLTLTDGSVFQNLNANNITTGTVATARLGSGTANSSTFLRGDGTWAPAGGVTVGTLSQRLAIGSPTAGQQFLQTDGLEGLWTYNGRRWDFNGDANRYLINDQFASYPSGATRQHENFGIANGGSITGTIADSSVLQFRQGVWRASTGTSSASGIGAITHTSAGFTILDSTIIYGEWVCRTPTLSTSGERYRIRIGFSNPTTSNNGGYYFHYSDADSSGNYVTVSSNTSATQFTRRNTGVVANTVWNKFAIKLTAINNVRTAQYYINDILVATHTTTGPPANPDEMIVRPLSNPSAYLSSMTIFKSVGTAARFLDVDRVQVYDILGFNN